MGKNTKSILAGLIMFLAIVEAIITYHYKSDWILAIFVIPSGVVLNRIMTAQIDYSKLRTKVKPAQWYTIGILCMVGGTVLMPQSVSGFISGLVEMAAYALSFILWEVGFLVVFIASRLRNAFGKKKEN